MLMSDARAIPKMTKKWLLTKNIHPSMKPACRSSTVQAERCSSEKQNKKTFLNESIKCGPRKINKSVAVISDETEVMS